MTDVGMKSETETMREAGQSVAADLKAVAGQKLDEAMAGVKAKAEDARSSVAGEVDNVASVLRKASQDMRDGSPQERSIAFVARSLADASDAMRNKDVGEMLQSVTRVARQNPVLFLGGAALLGFAASRYLKASDDGSSRGYQSDYRSDYQSGGSSGGSSRGSSGRGMDEVNTFDDDGMNDRSGEVFP